MKKLATLVLSFLILTLAASCGGNDEARKKYEQEKTKLENMKRDHKREYDIAIARGASKWEAGRLQIEQKRAEMEQADLVVRCAKEAGLDKD